MATTVPSIFQRKNEGISSSIDTLLMLYIAAMSPTKNAKLDIK
jgi:hypothetical protein